MSNGHGRISYVGGGDNSQLTDEQQYLVEERIRRRNEEPGALLTIVEVRVYEHGAEPGVGFPEGALLCVETDSDVVADEVTRARAELEIRS